MADVIITFTVPSARVAEAIAAFLEMYPNITDDPSQWGEDPLSNARWIEYRIRQWVNDVIDDGRRQIHRVDNPEPNREDFAE